MNTFPLCLRSSLPCQPALFSEDHALKAKPRQICSNEKHRPLELRERLDRLVGSGEHTENVESDLFRLLVLLIRRHWTGTIGGREHPRSCSEVGTGQR